MTEDQLPCGLQKVEKPKSYSRSKKKGEDRSPLCDTALNIFSSLCRLCCTIVTNSKNSCNVTPALPVSLSPGDIFVIEPLDFEVSHEYYITIEATDGGSPPLSDMATVNINLTDVNDNRPVFSQETYTAVVSEDTELGKTVMAVRTHTLPTRLLWGNNTKLL